MTERHIFSDHTTLVVRSLKGCVAQNPTLNLIPSLRVVYNAAHDTNKVSIICGGGAGHEPGSTGFVGRGFLTASVSGDVFASPSARQVYGGIKAVPSKKGCILIITNYTGDNLHFSLACQQARADGYENVDIVVVSDDVSIGRKAGALVGRRALSGTILVCKIMGAACEADWSYEQVLALGRSVTSRLASIAATLDHAHVPGRSEFHQIPKDTVEIGLGLHNEPGYMVVSPQPSAEDLIARLLKFLLDDQDPDRSFVKFAPSDVVILQVGNMGGMSTLEIGAVVDEALTQLAALGYRPARIYSGSFMTSMNAPGISLSLLNVTSIASDLNTTVEAILELVDAPHSTNNWPSCNMYPLPKDFASRKREEQIVEPAKEENGHANGNGKVVSPSLKVDPSTLKNILVKAAGQVAAAEPDLTRWDTIVGDGDCGETCLLGANAVLKAVKEGLADDGELVHVLRELTELIDDTCGGTLGAIFSIFLAGLTSEVRRSAPSNPTVNAAYFGRVGLAALEILQRSTAARVGHRTVMDALIPFIEALAEKTDLKAAVEACKQGGEGTAALTAKLGRATYVGEREGGLPPDPGAMAVVVMTKGFLEGYNA